jgi:hypothetical protein
MSDLPDVYAEEGDDGYVTVVANTKARRFINKCFGGGPPRWNKVTGTEYLTSPEYRAIGIGVGPVPDLMLGECHRAGLSAMFLCCKCDDLHVVDDAMAERFARKAAPFAVTLQ